MKKLAYLLAAIALTYFSMAFMERRFVWGLVDGSRQTKRLANVRDFRAGLRDAIVARFIDALPAERRDAILVLGDSQPYGFRLPAERTFPAILGEYTRRPVWNLSIVDGRLGDSLRVVEQLAAAGVRSRYLIININPSHARTGFTDCLHLCAESYLPIGSITTMWELRQAEPLGLERVRVDSFLYHAQPDYYLDLEPGPLVSGLERLLQRVEALNVAEVVIAFASPNQQAAFVVPPFNFDFDTRAALDAALVACERFEHALCVDLRDATTLEMHDDIIHLNELGHRRLAELLTPLISTSN